ncbi:hypothetical protein LTR56_026768 [Elasticomyces elasticus]|nr:hypothetical protein LTR56_026768 [Elasticomyces elasticus]KAK3617606.1 hypothetical protein LTR22_026684 [Elasticomyces elasticus]
MENGSPGVHELVATGNVTRKYNFTNAPRPWSMCWLRQARKRPSIPDLRELLKAAHNLEAYEEYSRISFDSIRLHIGFFGLREGLALEIRVYLYERRAKMVQELDKVVQTATSALSSLSNSHWSEICSAWAAQVRNRGLWPLPRTSQEYSIEGLLETLEAFEEPRHLLQGKDLCDCRNQD